MGLLQTILNPGATLGQSLAMNGIDGTLSQAYIATLMDKDVLEQISEQLLPEDAARLRNILNAVDTLGTAMDVAQLPAAVANLGPQAILLELISAGSSARDVHQAHRSFIGAMDDAGVPGYERSTITINGKQITLYVDASGSSNNHGRQYSGETEYYIDHNNQNLSASEKDALKTEIAQHIARTQNEAAHASSYDISMGIMRALDPGLAASIQKLNDRGLATCLPNAENGPTLSSPAECADMSLRHGGLY